MNKTTALLLASFISASPVIAESNFLTKEAGVVFIATPASPGLKVSKIKVLPYINLQHKSGFFMKAKEGIGYHAVNNGKQTLDFAINYDWGRKESADTRLKGIGNTAGSVVARIAGSQQIGRNTLKAYVEKLTASHKGLRSQIAIERKLYANAKSMFFLKGEIYAQYLDSKYSNARYGITASQSTASKLAQYKASSGFDLAGIKLHGYKFITGTTYVKGTLALSAVLGSAKNTPLNQESKYIGGSIVFGTKF